MSAQTTTYSPDFQNFLHLVEVALTQAAVDARELAERTRTPLIVRTPKKQESLKGSVPADSGNARKKGQQM